MSPNISKSLKRKNFSSQESPKKPNWIKIKVESENAVNLRKKLKANRVITVCEEAMCPNLSDCWSKNHATFMILGDICTRSCSFCNIGTGKPTSLDSFEPYRIANSVQELKLNHVVITSVDRDDLYDGGATQFVKTISQIKKRSPKTSIEILTPDFKNKQNAIYMLSECNIDVFNHNLETVKRLYKDIRPGANYKNSLNLLKKIKELKPSVFTKSGIMIGLGETYDEILELMEDLIKYQVDFLTIGQYMRPTKFHHPVIEYHHPEYFAKLHEEAIKIGFKIVSSSPFTRSSFHAEKDFIRLKELNAQTS